MTGEDRSSVRTTIGVAAAVVGLTIAQPLATVAAPAVLAALVIEGSSTNQSGNGIEDFFRGTFSQDAPVYVNFLTGPFGIWRALASSPDEQNTVMSSGWGAANASLLLSYLEATDDPALNGTTWVLDNNVANPNGGFGTRYPVFAVIGVNPIPTPSVDAENTTVISTAYEYDINGNAPKYILNPVADLNSLMAYFDRRLTQADLVLPVDDDGNPSCGSTPSCTLTTQGDVTFVTYTDAAGELVTARVTQVGGVTYVGYQQDELPLLRPLRDFGGEAGDKLVDAVEPALKAVVDWGYPNNDPLANPGDYQPAGLLPSAEENRKFVTDFVTGLRQGAATLTGGAKPAQPNLRQQRSELRQTVLEAQQESQDQNAIEADQTGEDTAPRRLGPPKPQPISVRDAVQRLTKAFTPKRIGESSGKHAASENSPNATG